LKQLRLVQPHHTPPKLEFGLEVIELHVFLNTFPLDSLALEQPPTSNASK